MEILQFLTKEQINGLLIILERDNILPKISDKLKMIRKSDKYKENYTIIEDIYTKCNDLAKKLDELKINHYISTSVNKEDLDRKTLESLKIREVYTIKNKILDDLKTRLQLIVPSNFETITENIVKYIDVDKYLYIDKEVLLNDEDDDIDEDDD